MDSVPALVLTLVGLGAASWATFLIQGDGWPDTGQDRVTTALSLMPGWLLPCVGLGLARWRPASRSGVLAVLLGISWSLWIGLAASAGTARAWSVAALMLVRPLTFWLLLSWPSGRLRSRDRRWLSAYTAAEIVLWGMIPYLFDPVYALTEESNPLAFVSLPGLVSISESLASTLVVPLGAVALMISLARRHRRMPETARYVDAPVLVAGVLVAVVDLVVPVTNQMGSLFTDGEGNWTFLGSIYVTVDLGRFAVLPLLLAAGALRISRLAGSSNRVRELDLSRSSSPSTFTESVARAFGGRSIRLAFSGPGGEWVDPAGRTVELGSDTSAFTIVERDGDPIAALEIPADAPQGQRLVDAAVSAAGAGVELERLEALAQMQADRAAEARRAIVRVSDETARRMERDLHDGAQQGLVGLMLQARLSAVGGPMGEPSDSSRMRKGILAARADLERVIEDDRSREGGDSLREAINEMVETIPIPISVRLDLPDGLDPDIGMAARFVAAEAMTNAVKHSGADHIDVDGTVVNEQLRLSIADNGSGDASESAGSGLLGLRHRVQGVGGKLMIDSNPGRGTSVTAAIPLGSGR